MPTIRIATHCTLPPARVLYAAYDFGPRRTQVWPAVRAEHLTVLRATLVACRGAARPTYRRVFALVASNMTGHGG